MKFNLDYTDSELQELSDLVNEFDSPIEAIAALATPDINRFNNLFQKHMYCFFGEETRLITDIMCAMKNDYHKEKEPVYAVYDEFTSNYLMVNRNSNHVGWTSHPELWPYSETHKTKQEWLDINPAYEVFLQPVLQAGDDE